jgi:hypothetical protein
VGGWEGTIRHEVICGYEQLEGQQQNEGLQEKKEIEEWAAQAAENTIRVQFRRQQCAAGVRPIRLQRISSSAAKQQGSLKADNK